MVGGERRRGYWLPALEAASENWERHLDRSVIWDEDITTWALEQRDERQGDNLPF